MRLQMSSTIAVVALNGNALTHILHGENSNGNA